MFREMNVLLDDVRGMGIVVSKLTADHVKHSKRDTGSSRGGLLDWIDTGNARQVVPVNLVSEHNFLDQNPLTLKQAPI